MVSLYPIGLFGFLHCNFDILVRASTKGSFKSFPYGVSSDFLDGAQHKCVSKYPGGKIGELPTVYLGMPLGDKNKSKGIWNNVLEKCEKKLVNCKSKYLSLGGRVTLINSVLDAMPTYMISIFPMPANVIDIMDAIMRNFLWQGNCDPNEHKYHLVKWDEVIQSKKVGGLGIRNLKL
ncbi:hypothetical protein H5410_001940 [Solanum commersonii]|uniref:Uncharacterized protein n=1 Tax=Solanum commersonii TaxID=4109 RepID=A0A9J6B1H9_SOLCO|nr:hypothetical protein H5410_001940 [Solanum commersonii]